MPSLRKYVKNTIGKNQNGAMYANSNKNFWYNFYFDYFTSLITNYYDYEDLPESIDPFFIEKKLCCHGFVGFFESKRFGLVASQGALGEGLDIYDNPTIFRATTNNLFSFSKRKIVWYGDSLDSNKAVIVQNNNFRQPSTMWLFGFCEKLADIEQTIQLNRNQQLKPYIIIADDSNLFSFKNIMQKVFNGEPVIYLKNQKTRDSQLVETQLDDKIKVLETNTPFLLDKLSDEKQRVINQVLTRIGINNNAVDKAERLVQAEATSNNGLIQSSIEIEYKSRKKGFDLVNKNFGTNIKVYPSQRIEQFNIETVNEDLSKMTDDFLEESEE